MMAYQYPNQRTYEAVNCLGLQCLAGGLSGHQCKFTKDDRNMRRATVDIHLGDWIRHDSNLVNGKGFIEQVVMRSIQELLSVIWITGEKPGAALLILERDAKSVQGLQDSYLAVSSSIQICLGMRVAIDWMTDSIMLCYDFQFRIQERQSCPFYYDPHQAISNQFFGPRSNVRNNWNP